MSQLEPKQLYQNIEKELQDQIFSPIYFFYGEESYLINQAMQYLKVCCLHDGISDFNFSSYYAGDADLSRVRDEIETLPMMSTRRVVILKEVQDLSDKEWQELESVLQNPVSSTVLILTGTRVDKRKKSFKLLQEKAILTEFKKPFENQIPGWIRQICRAFELEISDEAAQLMHRFVGNQLSEIEAEIKKLFEYVGARKEIGIEDVAQCVSKRKEENVFELATKIAQGNRLESFRQLVCLLENGQNEVGIVSLVARHLRLLLIIKQGIGMGLAGVKLAAFAQVPNYYLPDYISQSKSWSEKKLEEALLVLAETDKALKSSPLSSHLWLENLILRTCSLQQQSI